MDHRSPLPKKANGVQLNLLKFLLGCGFSSFEKEDMYHAMSADRDLWKKRPLTQKFISYAAHGSILACQAFVLILLILFHFDIIS